MARLSLCRPDSAPLIRSERFRLGSDLGKFSFTSDTDLADPILTAVNDDRLTGDKGGIVAC